MPRRKRRSVERVCALAAVSNSPLFNLSGEIRNMIWRFALVSDEPVVFTGRGVDEATLLQTCRAIREEAAGIFYLENEMACDCQSYDSTALLVYHRKLSSLGLPDMVSGPDLSDVHGVNWPNLKLWLKLFHGCELGWCPACPASARVPELTINAMFYIVDSLRASEWDVVEELLEKQHYILVALDPAWAA